MQSRWWDFGGDCIIRTDKYVRLASDKASRDGWIYSRVPLTATNWEVPTMPLSVHHIHQLIPLDLGRIQNIRSGEPVRRRLRNVAHQAARHPWQRLRRGRQVRRPRRLLRHIQEQPARDRVSLYYGHERRWDHAV
jgi:hypothetical protein